MPSFATAKADHLTLFFWQASISDALIGRDAFARSISPLQKRWNPPPVPLMATVMRTVGFARRKSSAAEVAYGPTVLEPSAVMLPLSFAAPSTFAAASVVGTSAN